MKFQLKGQAYLNNSIVAINDIGEGDNALMCVTDNSACCDGDATGQGQFYYPDNSRVRFIDSGDLWYRNRGPQVVRLNRRNDAVSPNGIYRCEIPDSTGTNRNISITITGLPLARVPSILHAMQVLMKYLYNY